jgi:beta-glucosidase
VSDRNLSLKERIGQMIVVRASGYLFDQQIRYPVWEPPNATLKQWLETLNLGGVILLGGSAAEIAFRTQQLQSWSPDNHLLIAADIEEGVGQRFAGATWFPPAMALGKISEKSLTKATEYAIEMGAITAKEALAIGINWILAPIVDVNNNPDNPVINIRSFAETPAIVTALAKAFILGANSYPVLTTAKHFPGHGDTSDDSHLDLPILAHDAQRLEAIELPPFQAAIESGVDSIMSAHLLIPAWDNQFPATLSAKILNEKLRQNLGFSGLIVTDALIMGGVTKIASPAEIAVMAVQAGADILLMPPDPVEAIEAVYSAVQGGKISEERINASWQRIQRAKEKLGQMLPCLDSLSQLAAPQALEIVSDILRDSQTRGSNSPVLGTRGRNLVIVDDLLNCDFLDRSCPAVTIPRQWGYQAQIVDRTTFNQSLRSEEATLLQIFIRGNPFRGSAGLNEEMKTIYQALLKTGQIQGLIIYGSPYVFQWFREQIGQIPHLFTYGNQPQAQKLALETIFDQKINPENRTDTFL